MRQKSTPSGQWPSRRSLSYNEERQFRSGLVPCTRTWLAKRPSKGPRGPLHRLWHAHRGVSDAQGSLIAAIGGTATAVGDSTAATGSIDNFVQNREHISIAMGEATFFASAYSAEPGMRWLLPAPSSTYGVPTSSLSTKARSRRRGCTTARQPRSLTTSRSISADGRCPTGQSRSSCNSPSITRISHSDTKWPTVTLHTCSPLPRRMASTPWPPPLPMRWPSKATCRS